MSVTFFNKPTFVMCAFLFGFLSHNAFDATAIAEPKTEKTRVGLVFDKGGKNDKSFISSANDGLIRAEKELKIEISTVQGPDPRTMEDQLRKMATGKSSNFDLIVAVGSTQTDPIKNIASQAAFAKKNFLIVDGDIALPNVRSVLFKEQEGAYLAGALAALKSKTGKIGFIGGMKVGPIERFLAGYRAGAEKVNPKIQVLQMYVGLQGSEAWNNPVRAKELALTLYGNEKGADIIFAVAGGSNKGVFNAAEETKMFAIGVDSNQNGEKPGRILTSVLKRVDVAVFDTCKDVQAHAFKPGVFHYDLKSGGLDLAVDEHNRALMEERLPRETISWMPKNAVGKGKTTEQKTVSTLEAINALKEQIIAGNIKVPEPK